ncbi:MAG: hypothetical protein AAF125_07925, partial [Chloroflexota bacterium]
PPSVFHVSHWGWVAWGLGGMGWALVVHIPPNNISATRTTVGTQYIVSLRHHNPFVVTSQADAQKRVPTIWVCVGRTTQALSLRR